MQKVLRGIKYTFWVADLAGAAGLYYSGIQIAFFLNGENDAGASSTTDSANGSNDLHYIFWAIYYMTLSLLLALSLFNLKFMRILLVSSPEISPMGSSSACKCYLNVSEILMFTHFSCGTLLLSRHAACISEIGIYLIVLGFLHAILGVCQWGKNEGDDDPGKRYQSAFAEIVINNGAEIQKTTSIDAQKIAQNENSLNSTRSESPKPKSRTSSKNEKPLGQIWLDKH